MNSRRPDLRVGLPAGPWRVDELVPRQGSLRLRRPFFRGHAGVTQTFTATVHDAYGNLASGYRGTLNFSSSDTLAPPPADYTFTGPPPRTWR
jgi:hypothetical protein